MTTRSRIGKWLWLVLVLSGCGGGAKTPPRAPGYNGGSSGTSTFSESAPTATAAGPSDVAAQPSAPPPSGYGGASAESGPATSPPTPSRERAPSERPGLGTEWGESRESRVRTVGFTRSDAERPFAVTQLFYNDRDGIDALARRYGSSAVPREVPMRGGMITVSVRDESGEPFFAQRLGDRTYVVGQAGQRYSITITNHTAHRFEAVVTVDGLDVINGRPGSLENRGYVLLPYATVDIDGFRQSMDAVAAFRFGKVSDSYAAQTGSARNVGVIGAAFFSELGDRYTDDELNTRESANPFPASDPRFARPPR